jgi:hypothetical protein
MTPGSKLGMVFMHCPLSFTASLPVIKWQVGVGGILGRVGAFFPNTRHSPRMSLINSSKAVLFNPRSNGVVLIIITKGNPVGEPI